MYSSTLLSLVAFANILSVLAFDPNSVTITDRTYWCTSQTTQCPLICLQYPGTTLATQENSCDPETLTYSCVCSNGIVPNATEYSLTLPYFICSATNNQCVTACGASDNLCSSNCRSQHPCGAQSPSRVNATTSSSSSTASKTDSTSSSTSTPVVFGGSGTTKEKDSNADSAASLIALNSYGTAALMGVAFVGLGLLF